MIVPLTVQDPPACVHLSLDAELHVHMRLHVMWRSPSRLVCIVIIVTLDDATWATSRTPTCPLLPWLHFNVLTARVLCRKCCHVVRALHTQLTLVPTLDEVTSITSYASKCSHYAIQDSVTPHSDLPCIALRPGTIACAISFQRVTAIDSASTRRLLQVQQIPLANSSHTAKNKQQQQLRQLGNRSTQ